MIGRGGGISRVAAHRIAQREAAALGRHVRVVRTLDELHERDAREPALYAIALDGCWIAYLESEPNVLQSSTIVVVDRMTGEVRFVGSANDEG